MIGKSVETIIGVNDDPNFGKVIISSSSDLFVMFDVGVLPLVDTVADAVAEHERVADLDCPALVVHV